MPPTATPIRLGAACLFPDPSGALWWPDQATLIVADLHLEKGSSFARRGIPLPPYDSAATLSRLGGLIERFRPTRIVALGDSFHDGDGVERLAPADHAHLTALISSCDWIWIAGNHDPTPPLALGGTVLPEGSDLDGLTLRHEARFEPDGPELSGHYHPKATVSVHGRRVTCRCFMSDARRVILPAFGAYAGGLDIRDPTLGRLFPDGYTAWLTGTKRVSAIASMHF
ncbi:MAG: ligase-associated DNA damage response endonuclease PdeM [Aliidongia sp.]